MNKLLKKFNAFSICSYILAIFSSIGFVVVILLCIELIDYIFDKPKSFDDAIVIQVDDKDIRSVCINDVLYYKIQDSREKVVGISVAYNKDGKVISCE